MAYSPIEDAFLSRLTAVQFPDMPVEPAMAEATPSVDGMQLAAGPSQTRTDAGVGMGEIKPIPRNKAQEALGYVGELLTKAGVQLDKYGVDIPGLGNITLKDLTVGDAGKVLEDMSFGFYPVRGGNSATGGIGTYGLKPDAAMELMNVAPAAGAVAKAGVKAGVKGAMAVGRAGERLAEKTVPQIMEKGGTLAELLQALSQGSRSQLTAYHGTPHTVDKFDSKRIGTGEGNQTYGYGLYFAENKDVAGSYATALSEPKLFVRGKEVRIEPGSPTDTASAWLADVFDRGFFSSKTADPFEQAIADIQKAPVPDKEAVISAVRDLKGRGATMKQGGNLYTVDIPDAMVSKMLDFDKPLSQQPQEVKNALNKIGLSVDEKKVAEYDDALLNALSSDKPTGELPKRPRNMTGEDIMREIRRNPSRYFSQVLEGKELTAAMINPDQGASEVLKRIGIPGVRYLDQGSRGAGNGTRNIVVFPGGEDQVKILKQEGKK